MAFVKETNRNRTKAVTILETIQNQGLEIPGSVQQENMSSLTEAYLVNKATGSKVRLLDSGDIAIKNIRNDGIYINRRKSSMLLSAKFININSDYLNIKVRPDGFRINDRYLNPDALLYGEISIKKDSLAITVPLFIQTNRDTEIEDLLKEFGII
jgi:hypothetical protein